MAAPRRELTKAPLPAAKAAAATAGRKGGSKALPEADDDIAQLLRQHNARFVKKPTYEPRTQSVAAMREWERRSGKVYASLSVEARIQANQEINAWNNAGA